MVSPVFQHLFFETDLCASHLCKAQTSNLHYLIFSNFISQVTFDPFITIRSSPPV